MNLLDCKADKGTLGMFALLLVLECWLGRTRKTRANSILDLFILGATLALTLIVSRVRRKYGKQGN